MPDYFVGVDGGATKSVVVVADSMGKIIGKAQGSSANIRISTANSWTAIRAALNTILTQAGLEQARLNMHAVLGLAGCEVPSAYQAFIAMTHPFKSLTVVSDAHIACVGAHAGGNGSIIVVGTGVVGYQIHNEHVKKVSGWGFPHDDIGGGAWLGLAAVRHALQAYDNRAQPSVLSSLVWQHFDNELQPFITWANQANSTQFAQLAPLVVQAAQGGDAQASTLLKQAAQAISAIYSAFDPSTQSVSLIGGIAPFLTPYLEAELLAKLVPAQAPPEEGALLLAQRYFYEHK